MNGAKGHVSVAREAQPMDQPRLEAWGWELGRSAAAHGLFVCLRGELGAGKSTLARAACRGAGVRGPIPSPTFTLINRYSTLKGHVYHADLYRLKGPEDLSDIGWEDLLDAEGAVFVEWPDRAGGRLPPDRWDIELLFVDDPDRRSITTRSVGKAPALPDFPPGEGA